MFDIGFTELLLVGVVALIVVGPERLPSLIRTALAYIRQFKSGFAHIKEEVERELDLHEMKNTMTDTQDDMKKAVGYDELHQSLDELRNESEKLRTIGSDGFEHADNVSTQTIEQDNHHLAQENATLPDPDSEADTGEEVMSAKKDKQSVKPS